MSEPLAYLNGRFVPECSASIPLYDAGFVLGTTITEQVRTFRGQLFRLDAHLGRLQRSLEIVGVDPGVSQRDLGAIAEDLVLRNHALVADGDDLGLAMFVTPGPYPTLAAGRRSGPTVCMHTYPLPFGLWAKSYEQGETLVTPDVRQVSPRSWPRELKCRSRMHYWLADRQARDVDPRARALLLDEEGFVTETTTASLLIYVDREGLVSPPAEKILPGISVAVVSELARKLEIPFGQRDLRPEDLAAADEVMLAGTTPCLLPVVRLNSQVIGSGIPGDIYRRLLDAWREMVGVDIASQAVRFAERR